MKASFFEPRIISHKTVKVWCYLQHQIRGKMPLLVCVKDEFVIVALA